MNAPGLVRRLAAMFYDALLLTAVVMLAVALTLPFSGGEAVADRVGLARTLLQLWVLAVGFAYLGGFWVYTGQTPGMKAWRMKLVRADGAPLGWSDAARRFFCAIVSLAPAGLGLWWMVFDRDRLALHDRWSRTRLVVLVPPPSG